MRRFSFIFILALTIAAGAVSWSMFLRTHDAQDTVDVFDFPMTIGEWQSENIPISDNDYAVLETRNAFVRIYRKPTGEEVMLYVIYSQTNRRVAHPPEICYTGGGSTIVSKFPEKIATDAVADGTITANRLLIDYPNYQQIMYYWFKVGNSYTASYWAGQAMIAWKNMTGQSSSSALIRLTSVVEDDDQQRAVDIIRGFAAEILPLINQYIP